MSRFRTITVEYLRELLEDQADDALVIFSADYGDFGHTRQALPLTGDIEPVAITKTGYSSSGFAIADHDDDADVQQESYLLIS